MRESKKKTAKCRQNYFDISVHYGKVKDCMTAKGEKGFYLLADHFGWKLDVDFVRQYPVGDRYVVDFAFVKERIAIEIDGITHNCLRQKEVDEDRDYWLWLHNFIVFRIPESELNDSYSNYLLYEVVTERRKLYDSGRLASPEFVFKNFKDFAKWQGVNDLK